MVYYVSQSVLGEANGVTFTLTIKGICSGLNLDIQVTPKNPITVDYVTTEPATEVIGYNYSIDFNCE